VIKSPPPPRQAGRLPGRRAACQHCRSTAPTSMPALRSMPLGLRSVVARLDCREGPARVRDLITLGSRFDRTPDGALRPVARTGPIPGRVAPVWQATSPARPSMDALVAAVGPQTISRGSKALGRLSSSGCQHRVRWRRLRAVRQPDDPDGAPDRALHRCTGGLFPGHDHSARSRADAIGQLPIEAGPDR